MAECSENDKSDNKLKTSEFTQKTDKDGCPELFEITEDNVQLPYEEKLKMFKKDAETLYEFALSKGLSANQIRTCLSPILGNKKSLGKRVADDSSKSVIILSVLVAIIAVLWTVPTAHYLIGVHAKLLSIKTIPFWDWTPLYFEDCIFNNPFLPQEKNFTEEDCSGCVDFRDIERLKDIDIKTITDDFLYADFPYVVIDAVRDWPKDISGELVFTLDRLNELFEDHALLTEVAADCEFSSTMEDKNNISQFVKAMSVQDFPDKFHVSWENCDVNAAKVFRMLASRPFFIPPFAEASPHNQVVVAKGSFEGDEFNLPQQLDSASWLIVLSGEMKITLVPHTDCLQFKCNESSFYLGEGEAVVVPSRIWNLTYAPTDELYTLGYSSTVVWDDVM